MIVPCIDLMDGKVVQLRQGREKVLEGKSPDEMLAMFAGFPEIQVIDLDAAIGSGDNGGIVEYLASKASIRAGGGVRTVDRAQKLVNLGARKAIIGTAAFSSEGINEDLLQRVRDAIGAERVMIALDSKNGQVVVKGWREATRFTAIEIVRQLEQYCGAFLCTYVDKEGMMQGTDIDWFRSLRNATGHAITAAGGITTMDDIRALTDLNIDCAIGMAVYTGRLSLDKLRRIHSANK